MKKSIALILSIVLCISFAGASFAATSKNNTLTLYTWSDMFPPEVLNAFEAETGYKVNYVNFDFDEVMLSKLQAAKGGEYDLVLADDYIIELAIQEGLVQKLDKDKIPNFGNINPLYQSFFYDPTNEYTVPYGAGVQTIMYNPDFVDFEVTGYSDLWDESFKDNIAITANYRVMVGMAQKVLGYSYNTEDPEEIKKTGEKLFELAPNIRLIKDDNIQDDLISGEVNAAVMYTSQVTKAKQDVPSLEIVYPKEGLGFGIMCMFIPSAAPNSEAAHAFIDYILRPEVSAQCFEYIGYYCTTKAAEDLLPEDLKELLVVPDGFKQEDAEIIQNINDESVAQLDEIWTQFKTLCGQA